MTQIKKYTKYCVRNPTYKITCLIKGWIENWIRSKGQQEVSLN